MIKIVLADDHPIVREGLRMMLAAQPDFEVVGEVEDGLAVGPLVDRTHPDVLILDLMMSGLSGLGVVRVVSGRWPQTRIIVLSMHASEAYVAEALASGAAAYVLKQAGTSELLHAIRCVVGGRRYLSPPLTDKLIDAYLRKFEGEWLDPYDTLTHREREVLQLAAEGKTTSQIAQRLSLSSRTVERHRATLMRKLKLKNQTQLVRYAIQRGLVPLED